MSTDVDLLIIGGGCAGLSLAWRLAELGTGCPNVLILDGRTDYTNDRTWCFWDHKDQRFHDLMTHQWRWLNLSGASKTVSVDCGNSAYQMLEASNFYDQALRTINNCPAISLSLGRTVTAGPVNTSRGWTVISAGDEVNARMVVDTRAPASPADGGATLWQSFYGHEVHCDADVFTPDAATLMDFTRGDPGQIPFTYVLPITPHRALIEATVFGPSPLKPSALTSQLDTAVHQHTRGEVFSIIRSENGILPMGLSPASPAVSGPSCVSVGVMAGGARASSGFAFQRIQQWADECCASIAAGGLPTSHRPDPALMRMMDRLFLQVLRGAPHTAPELFLSLFEKASSASVIRFLSGHGSLKDCFEVVKALPAKHFLRQLVMRSPSMWLNRAG